MLFVSPLYFGNGVIIDIGYIPRARELIVRLKVQVDAEHSDILDYDDVGSWVSPTVFMNGIQYAGENGAIIDITIQLSNLNDTAETTPVMSAADPISIWYNIAEMETFVPSDLASGVELVHYE